MSTDNNEYMLTTIDNPYNPFTQFDEWLEYDTSHGYNTCGYLARIAISSAELSEELEAEAISLAMDEIIKENVYGVHKKVSVNTFVEQ